MMECQQRVGSIQQLAHNVRPHMLECFPTFFTSDQATATL